MRPPSIFALDIIIVNWNFGEQLRQCMASIEGADRGDFALSRVCVVDNASQDDSLNEIEQYELPIQIIHNDQNKGFAVACNQGARESRADYLLFLNADVKLFKNSLTVPIAFMEQPENEQVGIVGIQLVDDSARVARTCARFPTPVPFLTKMLGLDRLFPKLSPNHFMREWNYTETRVVDQVMGAFFLVRKSAFESLCGFDERFFVYFEDLDFSYRAHGAGWKSIYLATAQAYHKGGGSSEQIKATRVFCSLHSRILYCYKHFGFFSATLVMLGTMFIEPVPRLILAGLHGSIQEAEQTIEAYGLLFRDLAKLLRRPAQERETKTSRTEVKRKILFFTNYPRILAAPRMRVFSYLPLLERAGYECKAITVIPESVYASAVRTGCFRSAILYSYQFIMRVVKALYVTAIATRYDAIFIRGVCFRIRLERILARVNPHIIFDLGDAVHLRKELSMNLIDRIKATFYDQSVLLPRMLTSARAVNLTTPSLREYVREYCPNIWVTPGPIQFHKYKTFLPKKSNEVVVGWIGSRSTATYLFDLTETLFELQRKYNIKIKIVGAGQAYQPPKKLEVIKEDWRLETEVDQLHSFDIGIMPLPDGPWERGKGGFKLLQYMSFGIPAVASPVGINALLTPLFERFSEITQHGWSTPNLRERLAAWQLAWGMFKAHPLIGRGLGSFSPLYSAKYLVPEIRMNVHNLLLFLLSGVGLLGTLPFVYLVVTLLRRSLRLSHFAVQKLVAIGIVAGTAAFLVDAIMELVIMTQSGMLFLFWLLSANESLFDKQTKCYASLIAECPVHVDTARHGTILDQGGRT